jgi:hypothetical protein
MNSNQKLMKGGNYPSLDENPEEYYKYKAEKYHYKCQKKLKEMMAQGKTCPAGYEIYLQPFSPNMKGGNYPEEDNNKNKKGGCPSSGSSYPSLDENQEAYYKHKAEKYHYKCQKKLKDMMAQGKACPTGYEVYLQPFQG